MQVEQREEVDGLELAVKRRRAANFRADGEVGAEQLRNLWWCLGQLVEWAIECGQRLRSPFCRREVFAKQFGVGGSTDRRVLRGDRTASAEVTSTVSARKVRDTLPKQAKHDEVAMLLMNASAAEFDHLGANDCVGREIKFLFAVVTMMRGGTQSGLQTIRADDFATRHMLDEQMVTDFIERIGIESGGK